MKHSLMSGREGKQLTFSKIVVDFAEYAGKNITAAQGNLFADIEYTGSDKLMQFRVGTTVSDESNNSPLPSTLRVMPETKESSATKEFLFTRRIGAPWTINSMSWMNPNNRVIARPPLGTTEKWVLRGQGGWSHRKYFRSEKEGEKESGSRDVTSGACASYRVHVVGSRCRYAEPETGEEVSRGV